MLEIEKGIEKPAAQKRAGTKYPWVTMDVGDSFFVPGGKLRSIKSLVYGRNRKSDGGKLVIAFRLCWSSVVGYTGTITVPTPFADAGCVR